MNKPILHHSEIATSTARPLPVIFLLDVSSSMGECIHVLNAAVRKIFVTLAKEEKRGTEFLVSIITFGADTRLQLPPTNAGNVKWADFRAGGGTPLGSALLLAKQLIEDKEQIPSRAWRPTVVLVSDGQPNDHWEAALADFVMLGRSSKCDRMAMAIGPDADTAMLRKFIEGTGHELFQANQMERVLEFFKRVTRSIVSRSHSQNPNLVGPESTILLH
jgi:uncharacterized protein YegL